MYPGRFDEQPMPLITSARCGKMFNSTSACLSALRTPKSPHPGHQSGSALPLKSLIVSGNRLVGSTVTLDSISSVVNDILHSFGWFRVSGFVNSTLKTSEDQTIISCTGTYCLVVPAKIALTPSTM